MGIFLAKSVDISGFYDIRTVKSLPCFHGGIAMKRLSLSENKKSQLGYITFAAFSYIPMLLAGGTFLVDLLQFCGFKDGAVGVIASLGTILAIANLLVFFIGPRIRSPKKMTIISYTIALLILVLIYVFALLPIAQSLKQVLIVTCIVSSLLLRITVNPIFSQWKFSFVPMQERGKFTATNALVSLICASILAPLFGAMRDYFLSIDKMELSFAILAAIMLGMNIIAILCMFLMKDAPNTAPAQSRIDLKDIFRHTLRHKNFCCLLLLYTLWNVGTVISTGFWDVYKMGDLGFSVTTVQIVSVVANILLILSLRPIGRLADRYSFLWCMRIGLVFAIGVFTLGVFTTPATAWMSIVSTILICFPNFAIGSNFDNLLLDYTDSDYFSYAIAVCNAIGGMIAFGASVLSGALLDTIQASGNSLFGITVYAQQVQSVLSLLCVVVVYILATFVIARLPKAPKGTAPL